MAVFSSNKRILVIDDEDNLRHMLTVMLSRQGYVVDIAADGQEGLLKIEQNCFDYILCDVRMPNMDGKIFVATAVAKGVSAPIIMMSAYGTVDIAVECIKSGAYDFISKPFKKDEIIMVLKKAEERERLKSEIIRLRQSSLSNTSSFGILCKNASMLDIVEQIYKVTNLKTTVLIQGESGTGKELIARAIHTAGNRSEKAFVAVNCAAISSSLLESELFGHVRGAFTDAYGDKEGLFDLANGGTLFLDEVGEMPQELQVKLLRVLQEEEIRKVGSVMSHKVNVRVVSATSRDLEADVSSGDFREDLFYRLNVFSIHLPPLRERVEDIQLLVEYFVNYYGLEMGHQTIRVAPDALRLLLSYQWPGNVRELQNVIERAIILSDGVLIRSENLPASIQNVEWPLSKYESVDSLSIKKAEIAIERDLIRKALAKTSGNRTQAAKHLEISHRSLLYKLKEYGIE